ncbi:MAG: glycogen/starch synthase [Candidatus Altiarchaeota archaeon]|nr:glycogen/starch synthase [Candidatus Altiarchaeota archaeon]
MKPTVFEISYEAANKVGGIYAVLTSKAQQMRKTFGEYYAVGPYFSDKVAVDFIEVKNHPYTALFRSLGEEGIKCTYGKWIGADKANCFLINPLQFKQKLNDLKTDLWNKFKVDSLISWDLFNEAVVWGAAAGIFLERLLEHEEFKDKEIVCQFHEWLSGAALLYLKQKNSRAGLVFTTHATTLGRTLAEAGIDIVREVKQTTCECKGGSISKERVYEHGVQCIHTLETACAHNADVFTTVSKITGDEARYILGKYPDVLTLNGVNASRYPSMEELSISHGEHKERIKHFTLAYFSPYYNIDSSDMLYFFTSGRNEFHNKGFDLLIDALDKLNVRLKREKSKKNVVVFFWIPANTKGRSLEVLDNLSLFEAMENEVISNLDEIREHIIESVCQGKLPTKTRVFDECFLNDLKRMILKMRSKRGGSPPINSMVLEDAENSVNRAFREHNLTNSADDRIKVIYYPVYLSSADGLLGLNYNEAIMGCHLGIFPSYYEPWGYTPLETAALGVPSVTTDLAGFGQFIKQFTEGEKSAIKVLEREGKGYAKAVDQLADYMYFIVNTQRRDRVKKKIEAKRLSELADWERLIKNYAEAYELALKKSSRRVGKSG